jgi:hypothetical protein
MVIKSLQLSNKFCASAQVATLDVQQSRYRHPGRRGDRDFRDIRSPSAPLCPGVDIE